MIIPVPWHLFRKDAVELANNIPAAAIDRNIYPPYELVWCLEIFDKKTERFSGEIMLENFDSQALRRILRRPPSDTMVAGCWRITQRHRDKVERLIGKRLNLLQYTYFIAASSLNHSEVEKARSNV